MNIEVTKEDIKKIGHTCYNEDGFLAIIAIGTLLTLKRFY